jgi:hypothetical protein
VRVRVIALLATLVCVGAVASSSPAVAQTSGRGLYHRLAPTVIVDSAQGIGLSSAGVPPGATSDALVSVAGTPPNDGDGRWAPVLSVTVVSPMKAGYLIVHGEPIDIPNTSTINFAAGQTVSNEVVYDVMGNNEIRFTNRSAAAVQVIAVVTGYFDVMTSLTPGGRQGNYSWRVLDTRSGLGAPRRSIPAHGTVTPNDLGLYGIPKSGASAALINLTVVSPGSSGYLSAGPSGHVSTSTSNLNFAAGQTIADMAIVSLGAGESFTVTNNSGKPVQVVADLLGYFAAGNVSRPGAFQSLTPTRIADTRHRFGESLLHVPPGGIVGIHVGGRAGIPLATTGVALTVTVVGQRAGTVTEIDGTATAIMSFPHAGQARASSLIAHPGTSGVVALRNDSAGTIDIVVDTSGYFR